MTSKEVEKEEFENAKGEPKYAEFKVGDTPAAIQKGLEGIYSYGAGNVEVTCPPAGRPSCVGATLGLEPYEVSFKGAFVDAPVELMNTQLSAKFFGFAGTETVTEQAKGQADAEIVATAENLGDVPADGGREPVVLTDVLPHGFTAVAAAAVQPFAGESVNQFTPVPCKIEEAGGRAGGRVACTMSGSLPPYEQIELRIAAVAEATAATANQVSVAGGEIPESSLTRPLRIGSEPTPGGVENFEMGLEEEGGSPTTQAGKHPFQLTNTLTFNQGTDSAPLNIAPNVNPAALPKDLNFKWPPGLIGNPTPFPRCTLAEFQTIIAGDENKCPENTAVGVAVVIVNEPGGFNTFTFTLPVFNLEPAPGEPARFGFFVKSGNTPVVIDTSLRTGGDYGVTVSVSNISQEVGFLSSEVTVWGVPGDPRHDNSRGWGCIAQARGNPQHAPCTPLEQFDPPPFLSLPGSCSATPLLSTLEYDLWNTPGSFQTVPTNEPMPTLDGCNQLPFHSQITVTPDTQQASRPSGLTVDVHVPQEGALDPHGLAPSQVRDITVALPEGVTLNPSAADGLQACTQAQVALSSDTEPSCPDASKIAKVRIKSPLLPRGQNLEGFVYLASPQNFREGPPENPFRSLVAMYLVAKDPISGVLVKLPGSVSLNETTGQITTTFANNPQLPFEDAELEFFGGERAPLATPAHCNTYKTDAVFTPWSGEAPVGAEGLFNITSGPGGTSCPPASLPFAPTLASGSPNINAGAFSPLVTTISREDGNQNIQNVTLHYPPGMSGILAGIPLCPEAQANAGTCGEESTIGETIVSVGVGGEPYTVTAGKVYLTEKYQGAPFGLSIVNPAIAGPFNLGNVVVRAKIEIDPTTAALTVTTGQIPHIIDGFPLQIKHINVTINRPGFTFNPTNCNPQSITGTIGAWEGGSSLVSDPFQVTNCAALKYTPTLSVSTAGKASKANGASLFFKIAYPKGAVGSQSWMKEMKFVIPKQLPSRLATLQKACLAHVFEVERQNCPAASIIGHVLVHTPVLPVPLEGPLYFVSYGGAAFPDAVAVIKGDGITIESHGHTLIEKGVTSATFESVPDVPFESIEVTVPQGPFSEFGAYLPKESYDFCGQKLTMPTLFKAQNGAEIHQNTPVGVTGCPPSVSITKTAVKGNSVAVTVRLGQQGTVKITGRGLRTTTKRGLKAGARTITVPLTAVGRTAKQHGRRLTIHAALTVAGKTGTATTTLRA